MIGESFKGRVLEDEPLARHTSLQVGGPADFFAVPVDLADLRALLAVLAREGIPWLVIGGGCNLLVRDGGFRGVALSLAGLARLEVLGGDRVMAEAGVATGALVRFGAERGLAGLEFLAGVPGSVGGALSMNAGAHGEAILDHVESLTTLSGEDITVRDKDQLDFGYRCLTLAPREVVLAAVFRLVPGDTAEIEGRVRAFLEHRRGSQLVGHPNAGSFFRNPEGKQAWRLIDEAGLRGLKVGGAQVAEAHANFLVNSGGARAADFIELARIIKDKVWEYCGIRLEEEVRTVGED